MNRPTLAATLERAAAALAAGMDAAPILADAAADARCYAGPALAATLDAAAERAILAALESERLAVLAGRRPGPAAGLAAGMILADVATLAALDAATLED
jgi:hypothetical protein